MMGLADRRFALKSALGAALLPVLATRPALAQPYEGVSDITPPDCEMIYRRTIQRDLAGGAMLQVERDFTVHFGKFAGGFRVEGSQISARVDAPQNLARLAQLEEQRQETGLFPLILDNQGKILGGSDPQRSEQVNRALEDVQRNFAGQSNEVTALLDALHTVSTQLIAELPRDLFAPSEGVQQQQRDLTLPWGDVGKVVTRFEAHLDPETRLMRRASREVITTLAGSQRRASEIWELTRA